MFDLPSLLTVLSTVVCLTIVVRARENVLDCFIVSADHALLGVAYAAPRVPSLRVCLDTCMRKDKCRSVMFYRRKHICVLNTHTKEEKRSGFVSTRGLRESPDYFERLCYDKHRTVVARAAGTTTKDCFSTEQGKVLIGIVDQQIKGVKTLQKCIKACEESKKRSDIVCKSAMYYEKEKECIIASQNKADSPDLFMDDDQAVYIENACFDGTTAGLLTTTTEATTTTTTAKTTTTTTEETTTEFVPLLTQVKLTRRPLPPSTTPDPSIQKNDVQEDPPADPTTTTTAKSKLPDHMILPELIPLPGTQGRVPQQKVEYSGYVTSKKFEVTKDMSSRTKGEVIPDVVVDTYNVNAAPASSGKQQREEPRIVPTQAPPTTTPATPRAPVKGQPEHLQLPELVKLPVLSTEEDTQTKTRKMRHPAVKSCFQERALPDLEKLNSRIVKAYSSDQCVDICRLCKRCLRRRTCRAVAYDGQREQCALAAEIPQNATSQPLFQTGDIEFYVRGNC